MCVIPLLGDDSWGAAPQLRHAAFEIQALCQARAEGLVGISRSGTFWHLLMQMGSVKHGQSAIEIVGVGSAEIVRREQCTELSSRTVTLCAARGLADD